MGLLAAMQARAEGQPWTLYIMGMPCECPSRAIAWLTKTHGLCKS